MKVALNKKVIAAVVITTVLLTGIFISGSADGTTPGSEADPVVTQSYVEQKSEQTKYYIDSLIAKNNQEVANLKTQLSQKDAELQQLKEKVSQLSGGTNGGAVLESILITKGKTLLTGAGTEVILRSGAATAVKGVGGGLANVTKGKDLATGDIVSFNNLLISAREDGRGIKITQDAYVMIRGAYTIK